MMIKRARSRAGPASTKNVFDGKKILDAHQNRLRYRLRNLKRVAKELGETMSDAELMEMIERADTDQDGEISPDEFYGIMTKKTFT